MNGCIDWGCPISADVDAFAQAAVDVYTDPESWEKVQQQGFRIVEERFLAREWKPRLIDRMISMNTESRHRQFVGRMLRHHHHRSTEYMSRWIEAKNRLGGGG